jgi:hypothetical protein
VARWKDGKIVEEYLFYDHGTSLTGRVNPKWIWPVFRDDLGPFGSGG